MFMVRRAQSRVLVATTLIFPLPYCLSVVMVRYRLLIEPLLLLMAALFLACLWEAKGRRGKASAPTRR